MKFFEHLTFYICLFILFTSGLRAMDFQNPTNNAQQLLEEIRQYAQNNEKKIIDLKQQLHLSSEYYNNEKVSLAYALCLMFVDETLQGKTEKLKIVINNQKTFQEFLTRQNLAPILCYVFTYALEDQKTNCITTIIEKYYQIFNSEIFQDHKQLNKEKQLDQFLENLIQNKDNKTVRILIAHQILNIIKQKAELAQLAQQNHLNNITFLINEKIQNDQNFWFLRVAELNCLAMVILVIYIYFQST